MSHALCRCAPRAYAADAVAYFITDDELLRALFADPRSDKVLERLVNEALAEDEAGETEEITGDGFV